MGMPRERSRRSMEAMEPSRTFSNRASSQRNLRGPGWRAGLLIRESRCSCRPCSNRSEEHTSELQSLMRNSYAVFCLKKKKNTHIDYHTMHATTHKYKHIHDT